MSLPLPPPPKTGRRMGERSTTTDAAHSFLSASRRSEGSSSSPESRPGSLPTRLSAMFVEPVEVLLQVDELASGTVDGRTSEKDDSRDCGGTARRREECRARRRVASPTTTVGEEERRAGWQQCRKS